MLWFKYYFLNHNQNKKIINPIESNTKKINLILLIDNFINLTIHLIRKKV